MAENAEDAFQILDDHSIDIVLCDVTLGNMDGFTFCQKVRENEKHRLIPFVFVTAKSSLSDKSKGMEVGGDDFITKPFDVDELHHETQQQSLCGHIKLEISLQILF